MDCSSIHTEIERLNLKWQEYDFGDTLYAEIPISRFLSQTSIDQSCETQKYIIKFQDNGYVLTFKEKEELSLLTRIIAIFTIIKSTVFQDKINDHRRKEQFVEY